MRLPQSHPDDLFTLPPDTPAELRAQLRDRGRLVKLAPGAIYLHERSSVDTFALVRSGSLRVFKTSDRGREITLYCVAPGECGTINVVCLLAGRASPAAAVAESAVEAAVYPRSLFLEWMATYEAMRSFVFGIVADKLGDMMALVEEIAFHRMDRRLAAYLVERSGREGTRLDVTHETIASDLGTAREVSAGC